MVVTAVFVHVKKDHVDDFIDATVQNHEAAVREEGNVRFDVLQSRDDPTQFLLYEAYESEEAAAGHKNTPHYAQWRDAVGGWMADPRKGVAFTSIRP